MCDRPFWIQLKCSKQNVKTFDSVKFFDDIFFKYPVAIFFEFSDHWFMQKHFELNSMADSKEEWLMIFDDSDCGTDGPTEIDFHYATVESL